MSPVIKFVNRVFTSLLLLSVTAYILFFTNVFFFALEVIGFTALALYEFFSLLKAKGVHIYRLFGVSMGIIIPSIVFMELGTTQSGEILFLVLGCLFLFLLQFFHKDNSQALTGIAVTLFGVLYVSWFLSFVIKIRFMENGMLWVAYLVAVTKAADIGAYSVGTLFGRKTLIPHVSPRKTVEGLVGGISLSIFVSVLLGRHLPIDFTLFHWVVTGLLIGGVGQIGDLSESLIKRFCEAKDSGRLLPGMGGVLDSIDSILFTAPVFYFHLKIYA
ncbi:MAG: hypothetical protein A3C47_06185 [Omnitrophica bacterium RIFCSPHIGHO2_02_FULL_51_18]|nr:MAG: hypothetical protein A3C47_06185 [Omnitrophica bacterium RIFCSPHIGHO2_02_FULL_51_18]